MKVSKARLRQIIREEIERLGEATTPTKILYPGEREEIKRQRRVGTTAPMRTRNPGQTPPRSFTRRHTALERRAQGIAKKLFPDLGSAEITFEIEQSARGRNPSGEILNNIVGFMYPGVTRARAREQYLEFAEEWIGFHDDPVLEKGGREDTEKIEDFIEYVENIAPMKLLDKRAPDIRAHIASIDKDPNYQARDVPVGRAATPGTREHSQLQRLMRLAKKK